MDDQATTLDEIEQQIARERRDRDAAIDTCQDGVAQWHELELDRLINLHRIIADGSTTLEALIRMRRRALSAAYASASWAGDTEQAARVQAEIDRLERGQV